MNHHLYTYRIYALIDPTTTQVHYVGGTTIGLRNRFYGHISSKCNAPVNIWIRSIKEKGIRPEIIELDSLSFVYYIPTAKMNEMEYFWINYFNFLGADLKNRQLLKGRNKTRSYVKIKNHLTKLEEIT